MIEHITMKVTKSEGEKLIRNMERIGYTAVRELIVNEYVYFKKDNKVNIHYEVVFGNGETWIKIPIGV